eukprot:NODE_11795_length_1265_cov_2.298770.p1 GENE.NODE_11795_length_1265_cov_2.298770~~NODE_11795_length_1265_cov_2.298770.p1  ORF type:complete len:246 (+),score=54.40 NODE_11795_length_1265_cov_2.298770:81-818(+)
MAAVDGSGGGKELHGGASSTFVTMKGDAPDLERPVAEVVGVPVCLAEVPLGPIQYKDWPGGINSLPPLAPPDRVTMFSESVCGLAVVLGQITVYIIATQAVTLQRYDSVGQGDFGRMVLGLILIFSVIAVTCLIGILCGNAGTINRSPERCFPLPSNVALNLRRGGSVCLAENIQEGSDSFCVRCLVWRRKHLDGTAHRCIAGRVWPPWELRRGNMRFFIVILAMAAAGAPTCFGFLLSSLHRSR